MLKVSTASGEKAVNPGENGNENDPCENDHYQSKNDPCENDP